MVFYTVDTNDCRFSDFNYLELAYLNQNSVLHLLFINLSVNFHFLPVAVDLSPFLHVHTKITIANYL